MGCAAEEESTSEEEEESTSRFGFGPRYFSPRTSAADAADF